MANEQIFNLRKETVVVPACVFYKGKNRYLNMNAYTNWHYQIRGGTKKKFTNLVKDEISRLPKMKKIHSLVYTLVVPSKTKRDRMNVYSVVDKFFCDALQEHGKIDDDSDDYINSFTFTKTEYIKGKRNDIRVQIELTFETLTT